MLTHIPPSNAESTVGSRSNTTSPTCNLTYNYSTDSSSFSNDILDIDISMFIVETENKIELKDNIFINKDCS